VDLSLHKLAAKRGKHLMQVALFEWPNPEPEMLMDVNKPEETRDRFV
jgi:hypothetical protein